MCLLEENVECVLGYLKIPFAGRLFIWPPEVRYTPEKRLFESTSMAINSNIPQNALKSTENCVFVLKIWQNSSTMS